MVTFLLILSFFNKLYLKLENDMSDHFIVQDSGSVKMTIKYEIEKNIIETIDFKSFLELPTDMQPQHNLFILMNE